MNMERLILGILINYLPHAVFWKDQNLIFSGCNKQFAKHFGYESPADIIGKTDYDLPFPSSFANQYRIDDLEVLSTGKPKINYEEMQIQSDGSLKTVLVSKVPFCDQQGTIIGVLGIYTDITERKQKEEQLKQAKEHAELASIAKTTFIANISHDLRTPISGIVGMSEILKDSLLDAKQKQCAQLVYEAGWQLSKLLTDVLETVSINQVIERDVQEEIFDIQSCIQEIVQLERPSIEIKGLRFTLDLDLKIPQYVIGDYTKIHRVLLNLLSNAIKFTENGCIDFIITILDSTNDELRIEFKIIDTGIGIPPELQHKVFERFFRVNPSYKGMTYGHGIGLHIAQSFVKMLGSDIKLHSDEGIGTTVNFDVVFKIPTAESIPGLSYNSRSSRLDNHFTGKQAIELSYEPMVLLVEDNPMVLHMAKNFIVKSGCHCTTATDAEHALESLKSIDFDLIITDIGLPGLSGYQLTQLARSWERALNKKPIQIVGLTAHGYAEVKDECIQAGMNDVFTKPITFNMMNAIIKKLVAPSKYIVPAVNNDYTFNKWLELDHLPLFDFEEAVRTIGSQELVYTALQNMIQKSIPLDIMAIKKAYAENHWHNIKNLAHKMSGEAIYCATKRMQYACQYLEFYKKTENASLQEELYRQLLLVAENTRQHLGRWLLETKSVAMPEFCR